MEIGLDYANLTFTFANKIYVCLLDSDTICSEEFVVIFVSTLSRKHPNFFFPLSLFHRLSCRGGLHFCNRISVLLRRVHRVSRTNNSIGNLSQISHLYTLPTSLNKQSTFLSENRSGAISIAIK